MSLKHLMHNLSLNSSINVIILLYAKHLDYYKHSVFRIDGN